MKFVDFIGNEKIKEQLTFLQESGRLPHAIVIEGEQGIGKRTLAREIALNLFCKSDGEKPCRECPQCIKVMKQIHPDIYEYSASGGARSFHVDVIRDVREDVFVQPNEADYKIYILGNCQGMSESAQNAILKILEEPPAYALFILTTTTKSALLETVLSRSVVISLEGVEGSKAAEYICSRDDSIDFNDATNAVAVWNGNIGKAIESLSDGKLSKISSIANDISLALLSDKEYDLLKACSVFERDRETLIATLGLLKTIFRDALLYTNGSDTLSGQSESVKNLAIRLNKEKLLRLIEASDNIRDLAEKNGNNAILITKICYEFRRAQGR
jgi:DNA polymerase-3 subunit delta'